LCNQLSFQTPTWLEATTYNNTFANIGNNGSGVISSNDLFTVAEAGDAAGVGNSNDLVIDMYFVQTSAGFAPQSVNIANGLAFVSGNGITTIKSISHNALQFSTARTLPRFNVGVG